MNKLLLATTNKAKQSEITLGLQPLLKQGITIVSLNDFPEIEEPDETGATFEENAKLKARYYAEKTGLSAIADDGGLMIDALGGEPGVKSRRWPGYAATDIELIHYALDKMKDIPDGKRTAQLATCVAFYDPSSQEFTCEQESIDGFITTEPLTMDTNGYPYRALFMVTKYNKFYDELTEEEHDAINHRLLAIKRLLHQIEKYLLQ